MKRLLLLGTAMSLAMVAGASAADLAPMYKAPPPVWSWTGCYLGGNVGGAWTGTSVSDGITDVSDGSFNGAGITGGVQGGCDYQMGALVVGVQGMFDGTSMQPSGSGLALGVATNNTSFIPWLASATGRVGYTVMPTTLAYVKGGAAWVRDNLTFMPAVNPLCTVAAPCPSTGFTNSGCTIVGGFEHMFAPHWSVFVEYDYMGFANRTVNFTNQPIGPAGPVQFPINVSQNVQMAIVGVNFKFWY